MKWTPNDILITECSWLWGFLQLHLTQTLRNCIEKTTNRWTGREKFRDSFEAEGDGGGVVRADTSPQFSEGNGLSIVSSTLWNTVDNWQAAQILCRVKCSRRKCDNSHLVFSENVLPNKFEIKAVLWAKDVLYGLNWVEKYRHSGCHIYTTHAAYIGHFLHCTFRSKVTHTFVSEFIQQKVV